MDNAWTILVSIIGLHWGGTLAIFKLIDGFRKMRSNTMEEGGEEIPEGWEARGWEAKLDWGLRAFVYGPGVVIVYLWAMPRWLTRWVKRDATTKSEQGKKDFKRVREWACVIAGIVWWGTMAGTLKYGDCVLLWIKGTGQ